MNSREPVNIPRDFMFTDCFTLRMKWITTVNSAVLLVLTCSTVQSVHSELYNGLINGVKEEVINHCCGQIQKVSKH